MLGAAFCELGSRSDKTFPARELAERRPSNAFHNVLEMRVRDAGDDGVDVFLLVLLRNTMFRRYQGGGLCKNVVDDAEDFWIVHGFVDGLLPGVIAIICGRSVRGVDGVQLALNERGQRVNPVDGRDVRVSEALERSLLHDPLVELLDLDVQAGIGILRGHDPVDGGIGETRASREGFAAGAIGVVDDEAVQGVRGTNGILASHHRNGYLEGTLVDALGDSAGDGLEDTRADCAGDDVGGGDLVDDFLEVVLGVDGTVIGDGLGVLTLGADLGDVVGRGGIEGVDDAVHDINEDDLEAGLVEELADEATADVAATKVDSFLPHRVVVSAGRRGWVLV